MQFNRETIINDVTGVTIGGKAVDSDARQVIKFSVIYQQVRSLFSQV